MSKESESFQQCLERNGYVLEYATLEYAIQEQHNDPEYVLAAIKGSAGHALQVGSEMMGDIELIVQAVTDMGWCVFRDASPRLKANKQFIQRLAAKWPHVLCVASAELKDDGELILSLTNPGYCESLWYASSRLKKDKKFVIDVVSKCGEAIQYASDELKKDKDVIKAAAAQSPSTLEFVSKEFKDDEELILSAITEHISIGLYFASTRLKGDKEFILKVVSICGEAIQYASDELKKDKEVVLVAVFKSGLCALYHVSDELYSDKDVILGAMAIGFPDESVNVLELASKDLRDDKEVVLTAVARKGYALQFASDDLKNDKNVVLTAVAESGYALRYASTGLKSDKDVVLTAVAQDGYALQLASDELRGDKDTVCKAVTQDWTAIEYASPELKVDTDVLLIVMSQSRGILNPYADTFYKFHKPESIDALRTSIKKFDRTMYDLHNARREVRALLLSLGPTKVPKTLNGCAISKLNDHGQHFATIFKRHIASFVGIPDNPSWYITCGGKDGPSWTLFESVIEDVLKRITGCGEEVFQYLPPKPFTRL